MLEWDESEHNFSLQKLVSTAYEARQLKKTVRHNAPNVPERKQQEATHEET